MAPVVTMKQLLEAGVHFGHQTRRWNPKMRRFIFGERNGIYIIDLQQTLARIETAYGFVRDLVADGGTVLFIGTKKQAQDPIREPRRAVRHAVHQRALARRHAHQLRDHRQARREDAASTSACARSGEFEAMPKKEALILGRELEKLERNLGGIRDMGRRPDAVFVLDTKKEHIAVTEANKLGIPVVAVVDTNCDPDVIQYVIPGNDDAIRAGTLMCRIIADAVEEGRFIASRRNPSRRRPAVPRRPPVRRRPAAQAEEEAAIAAQQAEARRQAAAAQAEREARLAAQLAAEPERGGGHRRPERVGGAGARRGRRRGPHAGRGRSRGRRRDRRAELDAAETTPTSDRGGLSDGRSPPRTSRRCARPPAPG